MKRQPWQCRTVAVLRDVAPDRFPVPVYLRAGYLWRVCDLDRRAVLMVEQLAAERGQSFDRTLRELLLSPFAGEILGDIEGPKLDHE